MRATFGSYSLTAARLVEPTFAALGGHHGVEVFMRRDANFVELAAVGDFDAPPAEVQSALLDYEAHPQVVTYLAVSRVLHRRAGEQLVHQQLRVPVFEDRDFALRVRWTEGEADGLTFAVDHRPGPMPPKRHLRLLVVSGRWDLLALADGNATRAVHHVKIDIGSVPPWMIRAGAAEDLPGLYASMRRLIGDHGHTRVGTASGPP